MLPVNFARWWKRPREQAAVYAGRPHDAMRPMRTGLA